DCLLASLRRPAVAKLTTQDAANCIGYLPFCNTLLDQSAKGHLALCSPTRAEREGNPRTNRRTTRDLFRSQSAAKIKPIGAAARDRWKSSPSRKATPYGFLSIPAGGPRSAGCAPHGLWRRPRRGPDHAALQIQKGRKAELRDGTENRHGDEHHGPRHQYGYGPDHRHDLERP